MGDHDEFTLNKMSEQKEITPPWKIRSKTDGTVRYRDVVPEGMFLEQLCIITVRLNDLVLVIRDAIEEIRNIG